MSSGSELSGYVGKFDEDQFEYVKPKSGRVYGRYAVKGEDVAAQKVTRYVQEFTREYSEFARAVGARCRASKACHNQT